MSDRFCRTRHEQAKTSARRLKETVIGGGYCVGCGGCAVRPDSPFKIAEVEHGFLGAVPNPSASASALNAEECCPFSDAAPDETILAAKMFGADCRPHPSLGYWHLTGALAVQDDVDREKGSSGGGVTWMLRALLAGGVVDAVAHVKSVNPSTDRFGRLFRYEISRTAVELEQGRKSAYYPVELSETLREIRAVPGRYAIVAIPCFAKAVRLAMEADPILAERIRVVVGIVCGHLKSKYYAEYLAWMVGVRPGRLRHIDFRKKVPQGDASSYVIAASDVRGTATSLPLDNYFATPWELGFMKYKACDYCDDVFAETADIVFGDAWIPPYEADWRGHNVVVSRRPDLTGLLQDGARRGEIVLDPLEPSRVADSQAGGLRHRREGLAVRLAEDGAAGRWHPPKRVEADAEGPSGLRRAIYRRRVSLQGKSSRYFSVARRFRSLLLYQLAMTPSVFLYYAVRSGVASGVKQSFIAKIAKRILARAGDRRERQQGGVR